MDPTTIVIVLLIGVVVYKSGLLTPTATGSLGSVTAAQKAALLQQQANTQATTSILSGLSKLFGGSTQAPTASKSGGTPVGLGGGGPSLGSSGGSTPTSAGNNQILTPSEIASGAGVNGNAPSPAQDAANVSYLASQGWSSEDIAELKASGYTSTDLVNLNENGYGVSDLLSVASDVSGPESTGTEFIAGQPNIGTSETSALDAYYNQDQSALADINSSTYTGAPTDTTGAADTASLDYSDYSGDVSGDYSSVDSSDVFS